MFPPTKLLRQLYAHARSLSVGADKMLQLVHTKEKGVQSAAQPHRKILPAMALLLQQYVTKRYVIFLAPLQKEKNSERVHLPTAVASCQICTSFGIRREVFLLSRPSWTYKPVHTYTHTHTQQRLSRNRGDASGTERGVPPPFSASDVI